MNIVCCTESFLPGCKGGGPVRALDNLIQQLDSEHTFRLLTRNHDYLETNAYTDIPSDTWMERLLYQVLYSSDRQLKSNLLRTISTVPTDWLYLHGALSPMTRTFLQLRKRHPALADIPVLLASHGNLSPAALRRRQLRKWAWLAYAKRLKLYSNIHWHAASEREAAQIKQQFGPEVSIRVIPMAPGVENNLLDQKTIAKRVHESASGALKLVYFGRLSPEKNLSFAFELLQQFCTENPGQSVVYDLIGPGEKKYTEKLRVFCGDLPENLQINYIGQMSSQALSKHLGGRDKTASESSFYHALFMPTLTENFSYTVLESLQAGIPILVSDQTPWRDLKTVGAGWDLPLDGPQFWLNALAQLAGDDLPATLKRSEAALRYGQSCTNDYASKISQLFRVANGE